MSDIMIEPTQNKRLRYSFAKSKEVLEIPNLIDMQERSYRAFMHIGSFLNSNSIKNSCGLINALSSTFPVRDFSGKAKLELISCVLEHPKHDVMSSKRKGLTYCSSLKAKLRLVVYDNEQSEKYDRHSKKNQDDSDRTIKYMKEQDIYLGDIPLMTKTGTFIINGIERVVVSQLHRSPGVFFDQESSSYIGGKSIFMARAVPFSGSWLDIEFDAKDLIYARIDRKKKFLITTFLIALFDNNVSPREEILSEFYTSSKYKYSSGRWIVSLHDYLKICTDQELDFDFINSNGEVIVDSGTKITKRIVDKLSQTENIEISIPEEKLYGMYLSKTVYDNITGEIIAEYGNQITDSLIAVFNKFGINEIEILDIDNINSTSYIRNTLMEDKNETRKDALFDIYKVIRQGESPTLDGAEAVFFNTFFNPDRYDLSEVGRIKINARLGLNIDKSINVLTKNDIIAMVKKLIDLREGKISVDDIDSLANRRVRSVGELVESQYKVVLSRMKKSVMERMSSVDFEQAVPSDLLHSKPLSIVIREFFAISQLSQFMDQTNILSEVSHKRKLSALGPGALTRSRAGLEVRDVHYTHYGKICPITTPEGGNIGLIMSKTVYGRINKYGFIESPYRKVTNGKISEDIIYLSSIEEDGLKIAQSNINVDSDGNITDDLVTCRYNKDFLRVSPEEVNFIDVSPRQVISVEAGLIPFMENNAVSRVLMGANMQRQAVPLLKTEAPLIGTGLEAVVAMGSGVVITAKRNGIVDYVDSKRIVIRATNDDTEIDSDNIVDIYNLFKFQKSNHCTCINQKPLVKLGQCIKKGTVIADGPATDLGELALGKNIVTAFMSWNGYCFEDSIVLSKRIVKDSVFTSIHIDEFEVAAMDMRLGSEEITRDIPGASDESLRCLDETGIVYIGSFVKPGDILVGKISPKAESPIAPEEKLLRAIFTDKASDVKDTSLKVPPGVYGTVIDVRIFSRRGIDKDERAIAIDREAISSLIHDRVEDEKIIFHGLDISLKDMVFGKNIILKGKNKLIILVDDESWSKLSNIQKLEFTVSDPKLQVKIDQLRKKHNKIIEELRKNYDERIEKVQFSDDLPPSVLKVIKVFIAVKREIQSGDKMAGRHGNKGVVSIVVPEEDMPYLKDGTPVDMILNPLSLPSRMNIGQILETNIGWAAKNIGNQINSLIDNIYNMDEENGIKALKQGLCNIYQNKEAYIKEIDSKNVTELLETAELLKKGLPIACPVFESAKTEQITKLLEVAGCDGSGQEILYDGRTGEKFDKPVTVGVLYMMKLHHLVEEKIHARSVGHYSLVTQQPLGGKSQFGGQRLGEMEVWALEAYGAAYILQEMITVKSDDVRGRIKLYESIVSGKETFSCGIPESFNVLQKELKALCLNLEGSQDTKINNV